MTTVAIATLGCKVNQFESESLMDSLEQRGYSLVPPGEKADIVIINTCTVTHRADFQSRQMIRRAVRSNPGSLVIVTGCYSQVAPDATERMEGVAYLLGNSEKVKIPDLLPLMRQGKQPRVQVGDMLKERVFRDVPLHSFHRHTRAFLKIQDGCNACCSYCMQTATIAVLPLLQKTNRGKHQAFRLLAQEQVEHDRDGDRPSSQQQREIHAAPQSGPQPRARRLSRYSSNALSNCMLVSSAT